MKMDRKFETEEFFIDNINTNFSILELSISSKKAKGIIRMHCPRAFQVFDESDGYTYLLSYPVDRTIYGGKDSRIITSKSSKYVEDYLRETPAYLLNETNYSCLVVTGQKCLEAIVFEDPEIEWE
jgi:hypothetical protein